MKILLLEDDLTFAMHVRDAFEQEGWTVYHEVSPVSARVTLDEEPIDLVVCDILIRGIDSQPSSEGGLTLITHIRLRMHSPPPILAITGADPMLNLVPLAENLAVDRILQKPINLPDLVAEVRNLARCDDE